MDINLQWTAASREFFEPAYRHQSLKDMLKVREIRNHLVKSPTGKALLDWADENGIEIWFDHKLSGAGGYYINSSHFIALDPGYSVHNNVHIVAHELRHAWQSQHGILPTTFTNIEELMQQIRFFEADAVTHQAQVAWELGDRFWSSFAAGPHRSAASSYSQIASENPDSTTDGTAMWAAFKGWFSDSQDWYDQHTIDECRQALGLTPQFQKFRGTYNRKDYPLGVFSGINLKDPENLKKLGTSITGVHYLKHAPENILDGDFILPPTEFQKTTLELTYTTLGTKRHIPIKLRL